MGIRLSFLALAGVSLCAVASPQSTKLNSELARLPAGDVTLLAVAPDGSFAIYQADATVDEEFELYAVDSDGGDDPILLAALGYGGTCELTPDGSVAVFQADHDKDGSADLFSVPSDGSAAAVQLSPFLGAGRSVRAGFRVTADGSRALYLEGPGTFGRERLYSVPTDGSASAIELNQPLAPSDLVRSFELDPSGERAVFHVQAGGVEQLYVVPTDGSASPVQLNGALVTGGDVLDYWVGDVRVVYRADQDVDNVSELYGVPLDASQPAVKLSGVMTAGGNVFALGDDASPQLVSGGSAVVYIADARFDEVNELFFAPSDGSTPPMRISDPLVTNGDVDSFAVSPDGRWVVYAADQFVNNRKHLFAARLEFRGHARRAPPRKAVQLDTTNSASVVLAFAISPASDRVVYWTGPTPGNELYSSPIDGSSPSVKISGALVFNGGVLWPPAISPDGSRAVYVADQELDGRFEVYSVPIDDSLPPVKLNDTPVPGGGSETPQFQFHPDGQSVFYVLDQVTDGVRELFIAPADGSAAAIQLSGPLTALGPVDGHVRDVLVSPDGSRAVYVADQDVVGRMDVYSVGVEPLTAPVRLNGALSYEYDVEVLEISADSQWVVFRADQTVNGPFELFSAPIDGSASAVRLNGTLVAGGSLSRSFRLSPAGDRVVYNADQITDNQFELFSVPIDGSAAPTKLSGTLASNEGVGDFETDGVRVVYRMGSSSIVDLYSVPIDGSAAPTKLNPTPVAGGSVIPYFYISSAGRVVYRADQDTDEVFELYSVPIDGSASAVKLNDVPVSGGDVGGATLNPRVAIDPSGTLVVYTGDQDTNNVDELYSVPIDGSAAPTKLNAPFAPATYDVQAFQISPDGARVVYLSNQDGSAGFDLSAAPIDGSSAPVVLTGSESLPLDTISFGRDVFKFGSGGARVVYVGEVGGVYELYSVPTDGSAAAIKVNDPPVTGGDVPARPEAYHVTPNGERVVYVADVFVDHVFELFDAPLDGSSAPVKLNSPLAAGGDVQGPILDTFGQRPVIALGGGRAFYIADLETNDTWEVFMSSLVTP